MNKNKYIIFNKDQITKKDIVYCRGGKSPEDIMKYGLPSKTYTGKFCKINYTCANGGGTVDDTNLYTLIDNDGIEYIFQYCGRVIDCECAIVPDTHYVRKIGIVIRE